jgi:hypothetical protein
MSKSILNLLSLKAIEICGPHIGQYMSSLFLVPKSDSLFKFILNLKRLNQFVKTQHFKMEDFRTTKRILSRNCYMGSVDLKDAFHLISVAEADRKYLRFQQLQTLSIYEPSISAVRRPSGVHKSLAPINSKITGGIS